MNDTEKSRCEEFARALYGGAVEPRELESAIRVSGTFEEFRVRFIANLSPKDATARDLVNAWRNGVELHRSRSDEGALLHTLETIAESVVVLEAQLRSASIDLLEKLKAIDAGVSTLASLQASVEGTRVALASMRRQLEMVDEVVTPTVD